MGNRLLVAEDKLRDNLRAIQARNDIEVSFKVLLDKSVVSALTR